MFEKGIPTPPTIVRFTGAWDMQDLYESMVEWFRRRKYKFQEKVYKHKHPSPFGIERQYIWSADREDDEYTEVVYNVYLHVYDAHDIEIITGDGNKKQFTKGRIWMEIKVEVQWDHEKRFNESSFYRSLKDFYNKYVLKKRYMQGLSPKYRTELYNLQLMVKERLKLENQEFEQRYVPGVHKRSL